MHDIECTHLDPSYPHPLGALPPRQQTKVIYVVTLAAACVVNAVNVLFTLAALKAKEIFTPRVKWSPLSFVALTHEVSSSYVMITLLSSLIQIHRTEDGGLFLWAFGFDKLDLVSPYFAGLISVTGLKPIRSRICYAIVHCG